MNCSLDLVEAYLDEELDAAQHSEVEQRLATCQNCSETCARLRKQKADVKAAAPYYKPPPELQLSIREALWRIETDKAKPVSEAPWRWLAIAASLLLVVSVSWNLTRLPPRYYEAEVAENILSDHIRSLLGTHLADVPSSDSAHGKTLVRW
jgi:anti-sigma factor RsiW